MLTRQPLASLAFVLSVSCQLANADVIYMDFNGSRAAPVGGGVTWNTVNISTSVADLTDSSGSSTGIGLTYSDTFIGGVSNGLLGTGPAAWTDNAALDGFSVFDFIDLETAAFHLSGLNDAETYFIELYTSSTSANAVDITIDGIFSDGSASDNFSALNNSTNVLQWTNMMTGGDGTLDFDFAISSLTNSFADGASINALRITSTAVAVPEPTSLTLLGLGLAGFGFSRKKKKA